MDRNCQANKMLESKRPMERGFKAKRLSIVVFAPLEAAAILQQPETALSKKAESGQQTFTFLHLFLRTGIA